MIGPDHRTTQADMGATDDALRVWAPNGSQVAFNAWGTWVVANADGTGEPQPIDRARPQELGRWRAFRMGPVLIGCGG